ncbi:MAG: bifunctional hydroxymethylpyrimidine kinase/phosphomethylpyrimidine kinase [Pyrinomonadaceae bacterium]
MIEERENDQPVVLTIAGFDPSGGAGIIADVRTILHFDCRPVAAITSLTFQNSEAVFGAIHESAESLRAQLLPVIQEAIPNAIKIGMIPTAEIVFEVARLIREHKLPAPVIDPVLRSSSECELMEAPAIEAFKQELLPLARLVTPNLLEAEVLTGMSIQDEQGMRNAAQALREIGARAVLIKGGHLNEKSVVRSQKSEARQATDLLDDDGEITVFPGAWIEAPPVRGTGCMLSSGIAACLAQEVSLAESIHLAKEYVTDAIRFARRDRSDPTLSEFISPAPFGRGPG